MSGIIPIVSGIVIGGLIAGWQRGSCNTKSALFPWWTSALITMAFFPFLGFLVAIMLSMSAIGKLQTEVTTADYRLAPAGVTLMTPETEWGGYRVEANYELVGEKAFKGVQKITMPPTDIVIVPDVTAKTDTSHVTYIYHRLPVERLSKWWYFQPNEAGRATLDHIELHLPPSAPDSFVKIK